MGHKTIRVRKKARSFQQTILIMTIPVLVLLLGMIAVNAIELQTNKKLAKQYIQDTSRLYIDRVNREMAKINYRLISMTEDEDVQSIPDNISPSNSQFFPLLDEIRSKNRLENIQYTDVALFFSYSQTADVLITQDGTVFSTSQKSEKYRVIMEYLNEKAVNNTQTSEWELLRAGDEDYILGWYCCCTPLSLT